MVPRDLLPASSSWCIAAWSGLATLLWGAVPLAAQPAPSVVPQAGLLHQAPAADFNLHIVVTEEFLNRFIAREQVEPGPVHEQIQEVAVRGEQCTNTRLSLDLLPSLDKAHAQIVLDGDVQTRTTGYSDQAIVHSIGRQQFRATKDLFFDGEKLSTRHAVMSVNVQNHNVGIQTKLDSTIFGPVANRVAARLAEQRRPQSEELSRQRVTERVYPKFNGEVDRKLADGNALLEDRLRGTLKKHELIPSACRITTSDRHLHYAAGYVPEGGRVSAPPPNADLAAVHAVNLYVHESALNGLLDRLKLKGRKTTDRELRSLGKRLQSLGPAVPEEEPGGLGMMNFDTQIEFDQERPIWVELDNEQLTLRIRATVKPMGQSILPPVELAIPFRLVQRGADWQLAAVDVDVQPLPGTAGTGRSPEMAVKLIRESLADTLTEASIPRELDIPSWPKDQPRLQLTGVRAVDGWLAVSLD
jgi:hypothetical protein